MILRNFPHSLPVVCITTTRWHPGGSAKITVREKSIDAVRFRAFRRPTVARFSSAVPQPPPLLNEHSKSRSRLQHRVPVVLWLVEFIVFWNRSRLNAARSTPNLLDPEGMTVSDTILVQCLQLRRGESNRLNQHNRIVIMIKTWLTGSSTKFLFFTYYYRYDLFLFL